jgi:hypothetical protein
MLNYPPREKGSWVKTRRGVYELDNDFTGRVAAFLNPCPTTKRCSLNLEISEYIIIK